MRETVKDPGRIAHMYEAAVILRDKNPDITLESIKENRILFFGLAKLIEIIGEAAYKLTMEFKDSHRELPWDAIIGMRHVMVHGYYTISPEKIWATITSDIPDMIPILEKYLKDLK
ncbi:MAG: DUF86 domain-containing protein [Duncaniella sp.]|nr:DUF86 domain-containing protein [Duncaniella sp.]